MAVDLTDPKEFALLALASHVLMRTRYSTEHLYTGALLAEWYVDDTHIYIHTHVYTYTISSLIYHLLH